MADARAPGILRKRSLSSRFFWLQVTEDLAQSSVNKIIHRLT